MGVVGDEELPLPGLFHHGVAALGDVDDIAEVHLGHTVAVLGGHPGEGAQHVHLGRGGGGALDVGHPVGGVCPFANPEGVKTYLDVSLKRFDTVFPAAGSSNSAIELTCGELEEYSHSLGWIDVCKGWQEES